MTNLLSSDDFVMHKTAEGQFMSGGYKIDSFFLKEGISPMTTLNQRGGGSKESGHSNINEVDETQTNPFLADLAIPAGLFFNNPIKSIIDKFNINEYNEHKSLDDNMYDELYEMLERLTPKSNNLPIGNKKKTRKGVLKKEKSIRKSKKIK